MSDDDYMVKKSGSAERVVLKKGSYKAVITKVVFSPISEWPDWKVDSTIQRHNEREDERKASFEKDGRDYEVRYVEDVSGLSRAESSQYVFYMTVVGGKHDGVMLRPFYTGTHLHSDKKYRSKSNLYKVLDSALPDVEDWFATNPDVTQAIGYPLMVALDLTEKGNQKFTSFMQSEDHGEKDMEVALGVTEVVHHEPEEADGDSPLPF
jgi:hypothetical protein